MNMSATELNDAIDALRKQGASIDGDNAYKSDLISSIIGALAFGAQDRCPPPEGHWANQFWDMGREASATRQELVSALDLVTDCLSKALTGGEVSAKHAGAALITASELIARQQF